MGSVPDAKANILLVGSGGVGTMAAYALEKGGKASVTAVLRSNHKVVSEKGFEINSIQHGEVKSWRPSAIRNTIPNVTEEDLHYNYVVITTKNIADIPPAMTEVIAPAVTPGLTNILLLQNGLNIERPFIKAFPANPVLSGITVIGASEEPRGTIKHDNFDISYIGAFENPNIDSELSEAAAWTFVEMYDACSAVKCTYDSDVQYSRWRKLLYNASFNTVATILRMDVSHMRASEHVIDDLVRPLMLEIVATAAAKGVVLPLEEVEKIITVDLYSSFFLPSMAQDMRKTNFIEFENIVGEPLREAEALGVPTPTLRVVYGLLKGLQFQTKVAKGLVQVPKESSSEMKYGDKNQKW
ncbi:putative 2-dehydropantoate 2-reductase family [Diaporthe ampelina]|uniref:Putative 2-dehydropantoate 2-reductase family n=1 Tax=Diaporthe ampelina TaxID=1214573 RepID=A0A0G2FE46_9PEZI|nr:putative 2-dehydropantoate 2-reductase family [Diaporthe ampelina]